MKTPKLSFPKWFDKFESKLNASFNKQLEESDIDSDVAGQWNRYVDLQYQQYKNLNSS